MKKIVISAVMSFALLASTVVVAQNNAPKGSKTKTEKSCSKKDGSKDCSKKKDADCTSAKKDSKKCCKGDSSKK